MRASPLLALLAAALGGCALFPDLTEYGECIGVPSCGPGGGGASSASTSSVGNTVGPGTGSSTTTGSGTTTTGVTSSASSTGTGSVDPCALGANLHGSEGVHVTPGAFPHFCVDRTEVSVGQYRDFLENHVANDLMSADFPAECAWKQNTFDGFQPKGTMGNPYLWTNYNSKLKEDKPVQGTDWCDAQIYCQWAGKHLCRNNAGTGPIVSTGGPSQGWLQSGQWYRACSSAAQSNYGYGNAYESTTCNTESAMGDMGVNNPFKTTDVDLPASCVASWPDGDVFNMNGNVMEWEDNCEAKNGSGPEDDTCYPRGGSYNLQQYTECDYVDNNSPHRRDLKGEYIGFRCCWTPP